MISMGNFSSEKRYFSLLSSRMACALWILLDDFLRMMAPPYRLAKLSSYKIGITSYYEMLRYVRISLHVSNATL